MKTQQISKRLFLLGLLCIWQAAPLLGQNLISNGDFEIPVEPYYAALPVGTVIPGWTVMGPAGDTVHLVSQPDILWPGNPTQYMDLTGYSGGAGIQSDAFNTSIGQTYELTLDAYNGSLTFPGAYNGVAFTLQATGALLSSYSLDPGTGQHFTYDFTATATATTLTFMDASGFDSNAGWIDNVSVTAVPEPATILLVALGLGFVGGSWSFRRRTAQA